MLLFLKNLSFTLIVPGSVAVFVPLYAFAHSELVFSKFALIGGVLPLAGGMIYVWCVWDFGVIGRGTPAPIDPATQLVIRGLYAYGRNPMYVGVLSVIFGWAFLFRSLSIAIYGGCVAIGFHLFVLLYEEPYLERIFGSSYKHYCSQTNRWLPTLKG